MAQRETDTYGFRADEELSQEIEAYAARHDNATEALKRLVRVGLREERNPLLSRWREQVINWAGMLSVFAVVFLAGGLVAPGVTPRTGYLMSIVLVTLAGGMVALIEVARVVTGQSAIGQSIREVVR
jgi:hypothetical protein